MDADVITEGAQNEQMQDPEGYVTRVNKYILGVLRSAAPIRNILISRCCKDSDDEDMEEVKDSAAASECGDTQHTNIERISTKRSDQSAEQGSSSPRRSSMVKRTGDNKSSGINMPSIDISKIGTNVDETNNDRHEAEDIDDEKLPRGEERTEKVMKVFAENSIMMSKAAMKEKKVIFADKIICNFIKKIHDIYGNEGEDTSTFHPLVNVMDRLPKDTPESIRKMVERVANDEEYMTNLTEKLLVIDLFDTFNMTTMKQHILNYKRNIISKMWPSAIETVDYESSQSVRTDGGSARNKSQIENGEPEEQKSHVAFHQDTQGEKSETNAPLEVKNDNQQNVQTKESNERQRRSTTSRYLAYASKFMYTKKYTKFGQHFSKNKVKTADGWTKALYGNIETFYRSEPDGSVSVKVRGKLLTDLIRVICVVNETELSSEWIPFLKEASNVHVYSKTTKVFKQTYEYPVVGLKHTSVFGIAINALDESGCFILGCRAPPENEGDVEHLTNILRQGGIEDTESIVAYKDDKCVLMGREIEPVASKTRQKSAELCFMMYPMQNHTLVELNANIMPEVRLVPQRVITYIIKKVIITLFQKIAQISNNFDSSPFAERMAQNREFYDWVERIYNKYMGNGERQNCNVSISTYDGDATIEE
ncbi:START-2 domain, putative [Babesia ovis]|uniref:START-2 domain, putative n=1 Tax=Babesia ovis TaxID=5869 RepID=A0A9W5TD80_BABOV|nr:START-2 domain, putative [Babesia ovis]